MISARSFARSAICLVAFGVSAVQAAPVTDVVFGNLGSSGTGALSTFGTDIFATGFTAAQGFTTGASADGLVLQSVTLGLFAEAPLSIGVKLLGSSTNSLPNPSNLIATSSSQSVQSTGRYTFSFSDVQLDPNTQYWITPDAVDGLFWYLAQGLTNTPTAQNSSGYSWLGAAESLNGGSSWAAATEANTYSVSVQAVPEPATSALAAIGCGVAGLLGWRRRKVAADSAVAV